ncbi:MAG: hypothetical protein MK212_00790 [Saprospiraceae bacterium]|nr:hypothetical protein [Saprospiraceae bacterium]
MKKIIYTLCCVVFSQAVSAQIAITDAEQLRVWIDANGKLKLTEQENVYELLKMYQDNPEADYNEVIQLYRENPFIKPYISQPGWLQQNPIDPGLIDGGDLFDFKKRKRGTESITGIGLPSSTLILGLTDFLVKRTKQELTIAFFREFQEKIKESPEMTYLFPATAEVLENIDENIYQFKAFWGVLRESFLYDLEQLPNNLDEYVQFSGRVKGEVERQMMSDFFKVVELVYNQEKPAEVIQYLGQDAYLHTLDTLSDTTGTILSLQNQLLMLSVFSRSLEDGKGYWVDPIVVTNLVRDTCLQDFYLGLIYEQTKNLPLNKDQKMGEALSVLATNTKKARYFMNKLKLFLDHTYKIQAAAQIIRQKKDQRRRLENPAPLTDEQQEDQYDDYYRFAERVTDLAQFGYELKRELVGTSSKEDSLAYHYLGIIGDLNRMMLSVRKKHYTSALLSFISIVEKILPRDSFMCQRNTLIKYGTFIATAVQAKTPQEVSDAIAAFALPPGGSAIKKYSKFSIAFNAYVGLSAGQERLKIGGNNAYYALTTPIGFTFNWGFKRAGAFSIFASALDIGALTAFRFNDNSANELPELRFENILAPGAYLIYGVPKYPISIGVGAQLGPNLRKVQDVNSLTVNTSGWRWGAFIAVDLPMVSIFSTNKKYKACPNRPKKAKAKK